MRDRIRVLYCPVSAIEYGTLVRSLLLFDEIHVPDPPSVHFVGGQWVSIGGQYLDLRHYERICREAGVPFFTHAGPTLTAESTLLQQIRADLEDPVFVAHFLAHYLQQASEYQRARSRGANSVERMHADVIATLDKIGSLWAIAEATEKSVPPDRSTEEGFLSGLVLGAMCRSAQLNWTMHVASRNHFSLVGDNAHFNRILKAKYSRAAAQVAGIQPPIAQSELSFTILEELLDPKVLSKLTLRDAISLRVNSEEAREDFLQYLAVLHRKLEASAGQDQDGTIRNLVESEILPAAREYRNKLRALQARLFGALAKGAIAGVVTASTVSAHVFGALSWEQVAGFAGVAGVYLAKEAVDAIVEKAKARRECALSYLLSM